MKANNSAHSPLPELAHRASDGVEVVLIPILLLLTYLTGTRLHALRPPIGGVERRDRLGGLIHEYSLAA